MKKKLLITSSVVLILLGFISCNSGKPADHGGIAGDSITIAAGKTSFDQHCIGCHNFRQDGIGPQLAGITTRAPADWILHFIKNPQALISSGDKRAKQLLEKYKLMMPSFPTLKEDELNEIIAFLNVHRLSPKHTDRELGNAISNPIPERIMVSNLVVNLKLLTQFPPSVDSGTRPSARITELDFAPATGDLFVLDLRGKLYKLQKNKPIVYLDMAKQRPRFINEPGLATGFGSFAFHPDFARNGIFYTTHTERPGSARPDFSYPDSIKVALQWVLTEWKATDPAAPAFSGTSRELLRVNMVSGVHGVQEIVFNPLAKPGDKEYGLLYIGIGDGGAVDEGFPFLTHNLNGVWGTILRIDPRGKNSSNGHYGIPQDNPFVENKAGKAAGEIYAYGFRNPHRISWSRSGEMLACNIGQSNIESIDLILPGHDYGWPTHEGNFLFDPYGDLTKVYPLPANDSVFKITYPVAEFDHDEANAISGGFEYQGNSIPQLKGKYLFGDIPSGRLFFIEMADIKQGKLAKIKEWKIRINAGPGTFRQILGTGRVDLHFGRDARGELYILTKADGKLYKLQSAG